MKKHNQHGLAPLVAILILVIVGMVGFTGWFVWHSKNQTDKNLTSASNVNQTTTKTTAQTDSQLIADVTLQYCKTDYKKVWQENSNVTVSNGSISAASKDPVISGNFARVPNAGCDSTQLKDDQKLSGFTAYYKRTNGAWEFYIKAQQTPACSNFDGQGWPSAIVSECYDSGNNLRAPN